MPYFDATTNIASLYDYIFLSLKPLKSAGAHITRMVSLKALFTFHLKLFIVLPQVASNKQSLQK